MLVFTLCAHNNISKSFFLCMRSVRNLNNRQKFLFYSKKYDSYQNLIDLFVCLSYIFSVK